MSLSFITFIPAGDQIFPAQRPQPSHEPNALRGRGVAQGLAGQAEARPHGEVPHAALRAGRRLRCAIH